MLCQCFFFSFAPWPATPLSQKPLLQHFPLMSGACVSPKVQLVIGGLWKIYNRWAVFEGYVFSNYLRAEGFDCVVAQATCSLHHPGPVAA